MVRNRPSGDAFASNRRSPTLQRRRRDDVNIAEATHNEASDVDSESSPAGSPTKPTTPSSSPARWISGFCSSINRFNLCRYNLRRFSSLDRLNLCRIHFLHVHLEYSLNLNVHSRVPWTLGLPISEISVLPFPGTDHIQSYLSRWTWFWWRG